MTKPSYVVPIILSTFLQEYVLYKEFLEKLTPNEWKEAKRQERLEKRKQKHEALQAAQVDIGLIFPRQSLNIVYNLNMGYLAFAIINRVSKEYRRNCCWHRKRQQFHNSSF